MTAEPSWVWSTLGIVGVAMVTAFIVIMLIGWLTQRRRPPA